MADTRSPALDGKLPQDGLLDPAKLDVAAKPKRRRRVRDRPAPDEELRKWEVGALSRAKARPHPPGIILEPAGFENEHWTSPHSDVELWTLQLADAFATRSRAVMMTFMDQLQALCVGKAWDEEAHAWRLNENEFSAIIAIVNTVKPRNEIEAALAAQMVGVHLLTMKALARALRYEGDGGTAGIASKLARTFTIQMDSLRANRAKSRTARQSIKVRKELHQHVHYHHDRGGAENERQPLEPRACSVGERGALPSPQPGGETVPVSGGKRKARV